jgi:hypothetical protein
LLCSKRHRRGSTRDGADNAESQSGTLGQVQKSRLLGTQNLGSMNPWSLRSLIVRCLALSTRPAATPSEHVYPLYHTRVSFWRNFVILSRAKVAEIPLPLVDLPLVDLPLVDHPLVDLPWWIYLGGLVKNHNVAYRSRLLTTKQ